MIQEQNHRLRASYGQSLKAYTTRVGVKTKNYSVNLRRKKKSLSGFVLRSNLLQDKIAYN